MKNISKYTCLCAAGMLVGCSSENSSTPSELLELQGRWADECIALEVEGNSERGEVTVSGSEFVIQEVSYLNNTTCDGASFFSENTVSTVVVTGEVTEVEDGNAKHINLTTTGGTYTASDAFLTELESQGTNLEAFAAARGVTGDINNLTLSEIGVPQALSYRLYKVDTLTNGDTVLRISQLTALYDGSSEERRPINLSSEVRFKKIP